MSPISILNSKPTKHTSERPKHPEALRLSRQRGVETMQQAAGACTAHVISGLRVWGCRGLGTLGFGFTVGLGGQYKVIALHLHPTE